MSSFYSKIFAKHYDSFMVSFEAKIEGDRRSMLKNLRGNVLDVGSGTGVNFEFFNKNSTIFAVEPSKSMQDKSVKKVRNKNIQLINLGINDEKLHDLIEENSLDAVVCTLVLCTISNPNLAVKNFKKWLKPTGKLIIIEHIHSDKKINSFFEKLINPLWRKIGEGCNLTRHTDVLLKEKGFISEKASYFTLGLRICKGEYVLDKKG